MYIYIVYIYMCIYIIYIYVCVYNYIYICNNYSKFIVSMKLLLQKLFYNDFHLSILLSIIFNAQLLLVCVTNIRLLKKYHFTKGFA